MSCVLAFRQDHRCQTCRLGRFLILRIVISMVSGPEPLPLRDSGARAPAERPTLGSGRASRGGPLAAVGEFPCTGCGAIAEFESHRPFEIQLRVARRYGFEVERRRLELYGWCAACRRRRKGRDA